MLPVRIYHRPGGGIRFRTCIPGLTSHILSATRHQLPQGWLEPVRVDSVAGGKLSSESHAAPRPCNGLRDGPTSENQGAENYDGKNVFANTGKDIWFCPLRKDWKKVLNR